MSVLSFLPMMAVIGIVTWYKQDRVGVTASHVTPTHLSGRRDMKICNFEGCDVPLGPKNRSGYCAGTHYEWFRHQRDHEKRLAAMRANYASNTEDYIRRASAWAESNREKSNQIKRDWEIRNPDKKRIQSKKDCQVRRAKKKEAFVEKVDPATLWHRDSGLCFLCGDPADKNDWHLGHVVPLARGGEHSYANTAVYHPYCNLYQGSKLIEECDVDAFLILREESLSG